jgi:hypothetical protein
MKGIYYPIAQHLQQFCDESSFAIWRDAFRWKRHIPGTAEDEILCNHYDSMSLEQLAEDFGYEIEWEYNLRHAAVVRKK